MRTKAELLAELNQDLPDRDWRKGAQDYLKFFFDKYTQAQVEEFVFTRPLGQVTPEDHVGALTETVGYLYNFANSIQLLQFKRGARVLDVACGGGWFAHWMRKLGYDAYGMDISEDFIAMARRRVLADPHVPHTAETAESVFRVQDFEIERLPEDLRGTFDAIVLESCLHHFFDPVAAMTHIAEGLAPGGVVLVLEGENRQGPIRDEYMQVMLETATLERPYPRILLRELLDHAGLPHVEFLGGLKGYFAESAWITQHMTLHLADSISGSNICVCGKDAASVQRVVPSYGVKAEPEPAPPAPEVQLPGRPASLLLRVARRLKRALLG
ncbi:MAG: class I SAM-dependent methyltransferase [Caulobacteraceae bacterium]